MNQLIKKLFFVLLLSWSSNIWGTTYYYVATGGNTTASDLGNWNSTSGAAYSSSLSGSNPSNFTTSGDVFDFRNCTSIDLAGMVIGDVQFTQTNVGKGSFTCDVTIGATGIEIVSLNPPQFTTTGSSPNVKPNYNFGNPNVSYTYSGTGTQIFLDYNTYNNLTLTGSNKKTSATNGYTYFWVYGTLSASAINIQIADGISLGPLCSLSVQNNTTFELLEPWDQAYYIEDNRTTNKNIYGGIWVFKNVTPSPTGWSLPYTINKGTYRGLIVGCSTKIEGNITVNADFEIQANKILKLNDFKLTLDGGVNLNSTGRFSGSNKSELVINGSNTTIYFDQTSESNRTLKNLTIGGNSISVTLGNWLSISGGTSTSGYGVVNVIASSNNLYTQGYLTLKSNQYGTAMIGANPGNVAYSSSSNVGTLLVENYIAGNSTKGRQYRFLSSPVSGGVFWQWRDSSNNRSGRGTHITGKTGTVNIANDSFDISTTNHPSAFYYDETKAGNTTGIGNTSASEDAGWSRLINAKTGTIENGKGYRVLIRGDRSITLTSSTTTTPVNTTIQTRGGYVAGPVSVPITNSSTKTNNGINLVGNPYACAVDWVTVQSNSTSVDPTYVAFDVSSKSYQSYNATGGGGLMSRYISPGQGFLVYTTAASTSLVFPTSAKTTAQAGGRIFTEIKNNHLITRLMKDSGTYDATIIYFIKGATNYYDAYDAGHIENGNVNLSSVDSTNTLYNLNCMDSLVGTRIIPLSLYGTPAGTYTMAFDDVNTFKNHDVYLIDNYLQKTIKVDDMTQYQVNVNTDKLSYAEGRLFISFEPKPVNSVLTMSKTEIFNISPNPVKDQLNIKLENQLMGSIEYEIYNISGQSILSGAFNSNEVKINTSNFLTGIYFINLRANNETQTIKFIK